MGGCIRQVAALSGWIMGYCRLYFRLGPLHLGCTREVAALLRWLLTQVSLYQLAVLVAVHNLSNQAS